MTRRMIAIGRPVRGGHTDWCARDHRCGLGEHRSDEIVVDLPRLGRAVLTRVHGVDGTDQAQVRVTVALSGVEDIAQGQLRQLLRDLQAAVTRSGVAARRVPSPSMAVAR